MTQWDDRDVKIVDFDGNIIDHVKTDVLWCNPQLKHWFEVEYKGKMIPCQRVEAFKYEAYV